MVSRSGLSDRKSDILVRNPSKHLNTIFEFSTISKAGLIKHGTVHDSSVGCDLGARCSAHGASFKVPVKIHENILFLENYCTDFDEIWYPFNLQTMLKLNLK